MAWTKTAKRCTQVTTGDRLIFLNNSFGQKIILMMAQKISNEFRDISVMQSRRWIFAQRFSMV